MLGAEDSAPDSTTILERGAPDAELATNLDPVEPAPDVPRARPRPDPAPAAPRAGSVVGRIVDVERRGVAGAAVSAFEGLLLSGFVVSPELKFLGQRTESGPDGTFELTDVPVTSQLVVRVDGLEFQAAEAGSFSVRANRATDVGEVVVQPGVGIRGVVLTADGKRLAGAAVGYHSDLPFTAQGEPNRPERLVLTDDDGVFHIEHARRGTFILFVQAEGYANQIVRGKSEANLSETSVTVQLLRPDPLTGTVATKPGAAPLAGARLLALPIGGLGSLSTTVSDAEGRFEFTDMSAGNYNVTCSADGHSSKSLRTWADRFDEPLVFKLPRRGSFEGQIVGETGEAIRSFDLRARRAQHKAGASMEVGGYRRINDAQGKFTAEDLEPGFYTFEVWAKGYALTLSEPVRLNQGEHVTGLVLPLERGASLEGVVVDDARTPVAGAKVSMHPNREPDLAFLRGTMGQQAWLKNTRTDAQGRFRFEDVTAMTIQVEIDHATHGVRRINDITVTSGKATDMGEIVIDRAATLTGVAEDSNGVPVPGQTVSLVGYEPHSNRTTKTNSRGEFTFDRVSGGQYALRAYDEGLDFGQVLSLAVKEVGATVEETEYTPVRFLVNPGDELFRKVVVLR